MESIKLLVMLIIDLWIFLALGFLFLFIALDYIRKYKQGYGIVYVFGSFPKLLSPESGKVGNDRRFFLAFQSCLSLLGAILLLGVALVQIVAFILIIFNPSTSLADRIIYLVVIILSMAFTVLNIFVPTLRLAMEQLNKNQTIVKLD